MKPLACVLLVTLGLCVALSLGAFARSQGPMPWRTFEGSWSASGHRESLPTEGPRPALTLYLSGALVLTLTDSPDVASRGPAMSKGFRWESIGFDDGAKVSAARCVWTDQRGDRVFSTLTGEAVADGRRFVGTITGGTGRYANLEGDYSFKWQYVVEAEQGSIQGRAVGLRGRYRTKGAGQ